MSEDQFTKLYKYIEEFRGDVDKWFDAVDREFANVRGAIAELSAQVRDYHNESIALNRHVDRPTGAIKQIAAETGVKLRVEI